VTSPPPGRFRGALRVVTLAALGLAPLALGAVHEPAFVPLLAAASAVGLLSWARGHWERARGIEVPRVPGRRLLLALHGLILLQLVPLPPGVLRVVSPGSFVFHDAPSLVPVTRFYPISVNPADTARGFCFLAGMSLLYAAVFREFADERWRRRLLGVVVAAGFVITLAALVQASSSDPTRIYGIWKPQWDWAVFGPYVSRNHFAGYLAMALPLALGFAAESLAGLRREWAGRRAGWIALGGPEGNDAVRRLAAALVILVGLMASRSRGGQMAGAVSLAALPVAARRGRALLLGLGLLIALGGLWWLDLDAARKAFATRGLRDSRLALWEDALPMLRDHPVLGSGFNAFGTAYLRYQTLHRYEWVGEAHNEYFQLLLDTGAVGAALGVSLLVLLLRLALRAARSGYLDAGVLGALAAGCAHNVVDFNWQIPANAATFAALAAIAVRRGAEHALIQGSRAPRIDEPVGQLPH
jgi:O-antigen ligase